SQAGPGRARGVSPEATYNADVYVFAVQTAQSHDAYDPLEIDEREVTYWLEARSKVGEPRRLVCQNYAASLADRRPTTSWQTPSRRRTLADRHGSGASCFPGGRAARLSGCRRAWPGQRVYVISALRSDGTTDP